MNPIYTQDGDYPEFPEIRVRDASVGAIERFYLTTRVGDQKFWRVSSAPHAFGKAVNVDHKKQLLIRDVEFWKKSLQSKISA